MKKAHRYSVMYYGTGGWFKRVTVVAETKEDAIRKTRDQFAVIEIYRVRYIG